MIVGIGRQNIIILFLEITRLHSFISGNTYSVNGNQTFILDSHRPFICSVRHKSLKLFITFINGLLDLPDSLHVSTCTAREHRSADLNFRKCMNSCNLTKTVFPKQAIKMFGENFEDSTFLSFD